MANTCFTKFRFEGSADEITDFNRKLNDWTSRPIGDSRDQYWCGNILWGAGLEHLIGTAGDNGTVRCAATVTSIEDIEEIEGDTAGFEVFVESKWIPMAKMWKAIIDKLGYKSVKFAYLADEPGCDIYQLYDPDNLGIIADPYYIIAYLIEEPKELTDRFTEFGWDGESDIYFGSEEEIVKFLQVILDSSSTSVVELAADLAKHKFESPESFMSIRELDIVQELYE